MQLEQHPFSSSSPLTSVVASSNPSIEPAPAPGARVKVTYSRKTVEQQDTDPSSSSQPPSPSENLFDSPMRSYGRNCANAPEQDANNVTVTTEVSPATTAPASNSAVKPGSSLFRRLDSCPSHQSDDEQDAQDESSNSPAVHRSTKRFQFGMAKAIFDSDSESDADNTHAKLTTDTQDDDAIIARIRAQAARDAHSDPFTGSLSSAPPTSSQTASSLQQATAQSDADMDTYDNEASITITHRRGNKISAMRGKASQISRSKFSSSDGRDESDASEDQNGPLQTRKTRTFKLLSSGSSAAQADDNDAPARPSNHNTALSRREKMEALAAKARMAHGDRNPQDIDQPDDLLDAFFGGGSPGRIPSRSPSLDIQDSDDDDQSHALPAAKTKRAKSAKAGSKAATKKQQSAPVERDILSDLEDDFERANAKVASKRAASTKEKLQPKVKPLTKKELETMHRQTARLARENRPRLSSGHQKKTIGLNELLSKIQTGEIRRTNRGQGADSTTTDDRAHSSSAQPSSQIPSGQSKSQHASDPIESSDPIPEHSSPHPNYQSSPVVPMNRQQERKLGLDQFTSSVGSLPTHSNIAAAASRTAGLATKLDMPDDMDNDDAELPDLASLVHKGRADKEAKDEAARKQQQLRDMKLRLLEKSRQLQPQQTTSQAGPKLADGSVTVMKAVDDDDDDLILDEPGTLLAKKHGLPITPGKKRPADILYRELGIRPNKTLTGSKTYVGTGVDGSPNAATSNEDQDEFVITDTQLRKAGKSLFVAADQAAGKLSATQPSSASAQIQNGDHHAQHASQRAGPVKMTRDQLNATLMRKMLSQSVKARSQKEGKDVAIRSGTQTRSAAPDVKTLLANVAATADQGQNQEADEDEDDPDYIMPSARDAESVIGSDVDMGSASENEAADDADDVIDMGSADEGDENQDVQRNGVMDTIEDAEEEHDSEKENAPPASQQSQGGSQSRMSHSLGQSLLPSRAVMDDDEDELPAPRAPARRGRRSALDDDDGDEDGEENSLQPGPFRHSLTNTHGEEMSQSQGRPRVPLGDISSQSIDQSMPLSRFNTSSPALPHAIPTGTAVPARRDSLVFPPPTGLEEDESFRTDDIPSQAGDLSRFFEPTIPPRPAAKSVLAPSQPLGKDFWDQTQTQSQSQSQAPSQFNPSTRPRPLARDESANSALGAFFEDTQQEELRGESLDIFENKKVAGGKAKGFTQAPGFSQLFADGTPASTTNAPNAKVWDASSMPPPRSVDVDAFAALRRAQMGEAMDFDPTPSVLPSLDESQAEREAYAQAQAEMQNMSPEKMYMNRDGFFTQTKPSQQMNVWSQYDTQSQAAVGGSENGGVLGAAWPSPALPRASARRASDVSNESHDNRMRDAAGSEDDEEDAPVQLKRLRRGVAASSQREEENDAHSDNEDEDDHGPPSSQPEPKARNAFDVLRAGPVHVDDNEPAINGKKRKSAFIEGEAEESEDEELGGNKRGDGGGLKGVFPDDKDSNAGSDDEDDEDDADAEDLQELVDNDREADEAEKDEVARARFREHMEAKDREDLEIHQKAIQGGYRNRRRGVGLNGLEGFLDDDADEEGLKRAAMGAHRGSAWKKRKLLDGTEDGMDALAVHEEAKAFVQSYAATHRIDHESDKYEFLQAPPGDDDEDDDDDKESEDEDEGACLEDEVMEEDAFGPVVSKQPRTMRYDDVKAAIRERRKAKNRTALEDDEERDAAKENEWDSDNDDEDRLADALHDRIRGVSSSTTQARMSRRKPAVAISYGRKSARMEAESMDVDAPTPAAAAEDENEEEDEAESVSLISRIITSSHRAKPATMMVESLEDAEPEWGNDANIVRAPKPSAAGTSQNSNGGLKAVAFKGVGGGKAEEAKKKKLGARAGSMLLGKGRIMRRDSGFSSSSR